MPDIPADDTGLPFAEIRKRGRRIGPPTELELFLTEVLGGKYLWKRLAFLKDALVLGYGMSPQQADKSIAKYQADGILNVRESLRGVLKDWRETRKKEQASKAAKAKAHKHPKWSQARRKRWRAEKLKKLNIDPLT